MSKCVILWIEHTDILVAADISGSSLPLLHVLNEDYRGINPYYSYPISFLTTWCGWKVIGEL